MSWKPTPKRKANWKKHEKAIAKTTGGNVRAGSGSNKFAKGDVIMKGINFLGECKETSKDSFSLKSSYLNKIATESEAIGKNPVLFVRFSTSPVSERDWAMIRLRDFHDTQDILRDMEEETIEQQRIIAALNMQIESLNQIIEGPKNNS